MAKREAEEERIREQRAKEQEERLAKKATEEVKEVPMTAAKLQKTPLEKMLEELNRIHRRIIT